MPSCKSTDQYTSPEPCVWLTFARLCASNACMLCQRRVSAELPLRPSMGDPGAEGETDHGSKG